MASLVRPESGKRPGGHITQEHAVEIQFLGAAGCVTGSKYLVTSGSTRILIDCGLFQGYKQLRLRNWEPLPIDPSALDAVVLTHAHLDHSGYLPLLVKNGFRGKAFCTDATADLCAILLPDSGHLQEEDAAFANRHRFSKHSPALPLYTEDDARRSLRHLSPVEFHARQIRIAGPFSATFHPAGHILGASIVALTDGHTTITFSGDLGREHDVLMMPPAIIEETDYLVVESTYGNRQHPDSDPMAVLGQVISDTAARGGVVVIPAFAVGRAQALLYYVSLLKTAGAIPALLPVFLDSPMARDATGIYRKHRQYHRLTPDQCRQMCHAANIVNTVEESKAIDQAPGPKVVIAASGMATGGRVLHHIRAYATDRRNTILFAGYQAGGTRGAAMLAGAESVKIHGEYIPIRAQVALVDNLSAHADSNEIMRWLGGFKRPPRNTFITHGEPEAADALRLRIQEELKWPCRVPDYRDSFTL